MITLGIDQGRRSGWGIAVGRTIVASGVATTAAQRTAVLELVRTRNGGTLAGVLVMFEDHGGMPLNRLTRDDHTTERRGPRQGAPERSTDSIITLGEPRGRWKEQLELLGHPQALLDKVKPHVWRAKLGIRGRGTAELKRDACRVASMTIGVPIDDHDHAEGVCIAMFAALDGVMRLEVRKAKARATARDARQRGRQGGLFEGGS